MRLALTGITSGVGRRLCEIALERGHEVTGLVREPDRTDARALEALGARLVPGSVHDDAAIGELCDSAQVLVHLAAAVGDWGDRRIFERVNVSGTRSVVEAAQRARVRRLIHLSSTAVYGGATSGLVTEEWPLRKSGDPYGDTMVEAERIAFGHGRGLGLEVAVLRAPVIYGPYDRHFMPRALELLRGKRAVLIDGGKAPLNVAWVDHVVDVALLAAERSEAVGEAFNVMDTVNEPPPSVREVLTAIAEAAGLPPPRLSLPLGVALAMAHALEKSYKLARSERPPPWTPFVVRLMTRDAVFDASKATRLLGWHPRMKPLDGIRRYAAEAATAPRRPK